ncbi:putative bifunctional diguanylate cyclase/phosphodiesterase [Clostridium tagluense]|uniref:putative bifunctional diguanylate cyclase/phosphodiesterase n=1 Tax=Clostridium tagluense TaxID=360422 RepID=UPI001C0C6B37|nr:bifunctional diguanylate cyclase/phosphodiesterase [Clostridium tagluense]MBU3128951.1 bifunctional diguanylate cyclase/phosphodiesterase [Clostridium tagluense]
MKTKLEYSKKIIVCQYLAFGMIFGFLFPISAIIFELITKNLTLTIANLLFIHTNNKLLLMIDTAPIFLGIFSLIAGIIRAKLEVINNELEQQSLYDDLTQIYNRRYGYKLLNKYISNVKNLDEKIGVMFLDIDRFKTINDTMGHNIGDELLKSIANRILLMLKNDEVIVRLGGDEFMIIIKGVNYIEDIISITQRIIKLFDEPFNLLNNYFNIKSSIGIAIFPEHGKDVQTLLKHADIAMYECKKDKKSKFEIFNEKMLQNLNDKYQIEHELYNALKRNELFLVYQPIINAETNKITATEALLRWNSPVLGMISPAIFIPVAESTNLIIDIGKWCLEEACKQNKLWQESGFEHIYISVNVSGNQIKQPEFVDMVKNILSQTELNPKYLKLELTESVSMENVQESKVVFRQLKDLGIRISLDDFGTGYSSFSELKSLFVDTLKIDKSFVDDIHLNFNNIQIVAAIISIGKILNLNIIVEGVETIEQLNLLKKYGNIEIQGYIFSKPVKPEEIEIFFKAPVIATS